MFHLELPSILENHVHSLAPIQSYFHVSHSRILTANILMTEPFWHCPRTLGSSNFCLLQPFSSAFLWKFSLTYPKVHWSFLQTSHLHQQAGNVILISYFQHFPFSFIFKTSSETPPFFFSLISSNICKRTCNILIRVIFNSLSGGCYHLSHSWVWFYCFVRLFLTSPYVSIMSTRKTPCEGLQRPR